MSLEHRIDRLGADLHRPVVLYDQAMRLVAYSAHSADDIDPHRREAILSRRTEPRALELIRAAGVDLATAPVVIPSDPGHADRIGMAIRLGGSAMGAVVGYVVTTAHPGDLPLAGAPSVALITAASVDLALNWPASPADDTSRNAAAIEGLLSADPDQRRSAARLAQDAGMAVSQHGYLVVVAAIDSPTGTGTGLTPAARHRLGDLAAPLMRCLPAGSLAAVLGADSPSHLVITAISPLPERHRDGLLPTPTGVPTPLHLGLGASRRTLDDLTGSAREARSALQATWRDPARYRQVASWPDLGADQLLLRLPLDDLGLADLPRPVQHLLGAPNGLELARSAELYLDMAADAQATARALMIHRSTLYYRLDRIQRLTGVDLRQGDHRHEVQVGLRVATLIGLRPTGPTAPARPPR